MGENNGNRLRKGIPVAILSGNFGILFFEILVVEASLMQMLVNIFVFSWLLVIGYIDWKEKIIPNQMILVGIIMWTVAVLVDILAAGLFWKEVLVFSLLGSGVCGGLLLIIAFVVKNSLGMGDVKLFAVLGLYYGLADTYSILMISIIFMAIVSIVLLLLKKVDRTTKIPMAPFVLFGFLVGVMGGI